jgi:predicted RNA-binding Zn ribbon-like protein
MPQPVKCRSVETHPAVRELPVVGGHLALDFANTVDDPEGPARHDHAGSYPELVAWATRIGLLTRAEAGRLRRAATDRPDEAASVLRRAHELRRTLNAVFTEVATGGPAPRHWSRLRPFVVEAYRQADLVAGPGRSYRFEWRGTDRLDAVLWPVARAAADLLASPDLRRIKRCAGCPWLFLDQSRNGSRRWCSMDDCGKNAKMRRYVARRAARRTTTRP